MATPWKIPGSDVGAPGQGYVQVGSYWSIFPKQGRTWARGENSARREPREGCKYFPSGGEGKGSEE